MQEAGATATLEMAFTIADGVEYCRWVSSDINNLFWFILNVFWNKTLLGLKFAENGFTLQVLSIWIKMWLWKKQNEVKVNKLFIFSKSFSMSSLGLASKPDWTLTPSLQGCPSSGESEWTSIWRSVFKLRIENLKCQC